MVMCVSPSMFWSSSPPSHVQMKNHLCIFTLFFLVLLVSGHTNLPPCGGDGHHHHHHEESDDEQAALQLKIVGIVVILIAGGLGVLLPISGRWVPAIRPERNIFFVVKAFAAGVILSTALVHVLPASFMRLGSKCLKEDAWHNFPFGGFIAMLSALGTLTVDCLATGYYKRMYSSNEVPAAASPTPVDDTGFIRERVIAQVLELGIVIHSIIIGISTGASKSLSVIRPLVGALAFHQFFEGMGLGSCIVRAKFKVNTIIIMAFFFSITTPLGIGIGIGVSSCYDVGSTTSLITEGVLDAASAGILIYMSLVDLLAVDFMSDKMLSSSALQFWSYLGLLLGAGAMSILAKWA